MSKKLLWNADDQNARLAELTAPSEDPAKDNPLRRDVRSLGTLLGQVLVEQGGRDLFDAVEQLRRLLIEHREQVRRSPASAASSERKSNLMTQAQEMVASMDLSRAHQVAKAFAIYFELQTWPRPIIANDAAAPANSIANMFPPPVHFAARCNV